MHCRAYEGCQSRRGRSDCFFFWLLVPVPVDVPEALHTTSGMSLGQQPVSLPMALRPWDLCQSHTSPSSNATVSAQAGGDFFLRQPQRQLTERVGTAESAVLDSAKPKANVGAQRKETALPRGVHTDHSPRAFVSFRLPASIVEALLRASMERRLNRLRPWAQQDLVAIALSAWLKKEGYLSEITIGE